MSPRIGFLAIVGRERGIAGFDERTGRELRAASGTVQKRAAASRDDELTAQEAQIARLARDGLSNPEIGTRLFISARAVRHHLRKVITKLGITSRSQLASCCPAARGPGRAGASPEPGIPAAHQPGPAARQSGCQRGDARLKARRTRRAAWY